MKIEINNKTYQVIIIHKNNKNTYIRVTDDFEICVTTSPLVTKNKIKKIIENNQDSILKMIEKKCQEVEDYRHFRYLNKNYDIIYYNTSMPFIIDDKLYVKDDLALQKWYKNEAKRLFHQRLYYNYQKFVEEIPYPDLKIRDMKTRWGVCNKKTKTITLNLKLLRYSFDEIDYVIVHELSHFLHFDHSKAFWATVLKYCPDYKKRRNNLR